MLNHLRDRGHIIQYDRLQKNIVSKKVSDIFCPSWPYNFDNNTLSHEKHKACYSGDHRIYAGAAVGIYRIQQADGLSSL